MKDSITSKATFVGFSYLLTKIKNSSFQENPFRFLLIEDFLSKEHFEQIINAKEISLPETTTTESLIDDLLKKGYKVQSHGGSTTNIKEYLACFNQKKWPTDKNILEGFGLTLRLKTYKTPILEDFMAFISSLVFKQVLEEKFKIQDANYLDTGIQKYLQGYEISPHADIRKKALTYMLNLNTAADSNKQDIHTQFMKFKPEKEYIKRFWKENQEIDRQWLPWNWAETVIRTSANNSIVFFMPSDESVHAIKLNYNHLKHQRTQLYGNIWYEKSTALYNNYTYEDLASSQINIAGIIKKSKMQNMKAAWKNSIKGIIPYGIIDFLKNK